MNPPTAVVYRVFDADGRLIYIGSTVQPLDKRMRCHRSQSWWHTLADRIEVEEFSDVADAREAEKAAIRSESPAYNQQHAGHWWASPMQLTEQEKAACITWLQSNEYALGFLPLRLHWVGEIAIPGWKTHTRPYGTPASAA